MPQYVDAQCRSDMNESVMDVPQPISGIRTLRPDKLLEAAPLRPFTQRRIKRDGANGLGPFKTGLVVKSAFRAGSIY